MEFLMEDFFFSAREGNIRIFNIPCKNAKTHAYHRMELRFRKSLTEAENFLGAEFFVVHNL